MFFSHIDVPLSPSIPLSLKINKVLKIKNKISKYIYEGLKCSDPHQVLGTGFPQHCSGVGMTSLTLYIKIKATEVISTSLNLS